MASDILFIISVLKISLYNGMHEHNYIFRVLAFIMLITVLMKDNCNFIY